jgi:hypothetical protein
MTTSTVAQYLAALPADRPAQLRESGETADLHGEEHFPMHSVAADLEGGLAAR